MEPFYCLMSMGLMVIMVWSVVLYGTLADLMERRREEDRHD